MKGKMNKRFLITLACLLAMLMSACGNAAPAASTPASASATAAATTEASASTVAEPAPVSLDPITIDIFSSPANYQGIQGGWFGKMVKDKFNMELNIIAPNIAGGGDILYQTRTAAGFLGDIFIVPNNKLQDCHKADLLYDITDLIKGRTNLMRYETGIKGISDLLGSDRYLGIPAGVSTQDPLTPAIYGFDPDCGNYVRWDLYEAIGKPELGSMDELLDALKAMQEKFPQTESGKKTYAFSIFKDWDGGAMTSALKFIWLHGYAEAFGYTIMDAKTYDGVEILAEDGVYKQALQLYFKANQMGLLDPDSPSQNWDTVWAKMVDGQILYSFWPWHAGGFYTQDKAKAGVGFRFVPVKGQRYTAYGVSPYGTSSFAIGSTSKYPERCIDLLEWMASPEGYQQIMAGPEGLTWEIKDGAPVRTEYGKTAEQNNAEVPAEYGGGTYVEGKNQINAQICWWSDINPATNEAYDTTLWPSVINENRFALEESWSAAMDAVNTKDYLLKNNLFSVIPGAQYDAPVESTEITAKRAACNALITGTSWQMVLARNETDFEKLWTDMKAELDGLGYQEVLAEDMKNCEGKKAAILKLLGK